MEHFTPLSSLIGGILIGVSATAMLGLLGRVAGISGILGGLLARDALLRRFVLASPRPLLAPAFSVPTRSDLDARLVAGAAIFGVGWGLGGGMPAALVVVPAMLAGMLLHDRWFATAPVAATPVVDRTRPGTARRPSRRSGSLT